MFRLFGKATKKIGLPPGTLVHVGDKKLEKVRITVIDYDEQQFEEREVQNVEECLEFENDIVADTEQEDKLKIKETALIPFLVKAIQEQQVIIDELRSRVSALEV